MCVVTDTGVELLTDVTTELLELDLMDLDQLKQILDLVREHELSEFEIEQEGLRLKIRKDAAGALVGRARAAADVGRRRWRRRAAAGRRRRVAGAAARRRRGGQRRSSSRSSSRRSSARSIARRSPAPPSFVEIGSTVKKGQVLCIIEAMKLMNEIDSEYDGEDREHLRRERPAGAVRRAAVRDPDRSS